MATEMASFTFRNGKIGFWNDPEPDDKSFGSVRVGILDVTESLMLYLQGDYYVMVPWDINVWVRHLDLHESGLGFSYT